MDDIKRITATEVNQSFADLIEAMDAAVKRQMCIPLGLLNPPQLKYLTGSWDTETRADYLQQLRSKPLAPKGWPYENPFLQEYHHMQDYIQPLMAAMEDVLLQGVGATRIGCDPGAPGGDTWARVDIQDFIDAADLPTWPPVLTTRTLTPNAERNRKVFTDTYAGRKCQCTASWTCDMCRHPGNPKIQDENPFCWNDAPDPVSDVVDTTVYRKKVSEW